MINNNNSINQKLNRLKRLSRVSFYLFKKNYRKVYLALMLLLSVALLSVFSIIVFVLSVYFGAFGDIPTYDSLKSIRNNEASEIYGMNNQLIGRYYKENRIIADSEELPSYMIDALVATEDERFFEHSGVDARALMRVFFRTFLMRDRAGGGGSTLSQQLAKNLFPREDHGIFSMPVAKFKEMIVARRMENIYSKEDLILFYLNTVPFGRDIYGVKVASNRFFNKDINKLKIEEAAVLVGMLKANSSYDPVKNPERSLQRRNVVLSQMQKNNFISAVDLDSLKKIKLKTDYRDILDERNKAAYFKANLEMELKGILKSYKKESGESYDLYTDGLKIYTSLDANLQAFAEKAVKEEMVMLQKSFDEHWKGNNLLNSSMLIKGMKASDRYKLYIQSGLSEKEATQKFKKDIEYRYYSPTSGKWRSIKRSPMDSVARALSTLHCGVLSLEPSTGAIRAWVGGIDYAAFQYDHIKSRRQVGSVFKPIVYLSAMEKGVEPCEFTINEQTTYAEYDNWTPKNADGEYGGYYSMPGALANSVNTMAVEYLFKAGIDTVIDYARKFGLEADIQEVPSIALGAVEASVSEMAVTYATIVNEGKKVKPYFIERVEDAEGNLIFARRKTKESEQVVLKENAELMRSMLGNVIEKGTAQRVRYKYGIRAAAGGKTGTTSDQADGWFVGFTTGLVTSVWVGADNPAIRWRTTSLGQGASTALPIWANYTKKIENSSSRKYMSGSFPALDSLQAERLDCVFFQEELMDTLEQFQPWEWLQLERDRFKERREMRRKDYELKKRREERKKHFRDLFKKRGQ